MDKVHDYLHVDRVHGSLYVDRVHGSRKREYAVCIAMHGALKYCLKLER